MRNPPSYKNNSTYITHSGDVETSPVTNKALLLPHPAPRSNSTQITPPLINGNKSK